MGHRFNKKKERVFGVMVDGLGASEFGIFVVAVAIIFSLPWTLFRLARLAWHIESKQGQTDHHKRIAGLLSVYLVFWAACLLGVGIFIWLNL